MRIYVTAGHKNKSEDGPQVFFADDKMAEQSRTLNENM